MHFFPHLQDSGQTEYCPVSPRICLIVIYVPMYCSLIRGYHVLYEDKTGVLEQLIM